ncbi:zinc finger protein 432 isoform X2 [Anastrepha obliqua]|uniref:zinc finger protein 432 isoform X2 n=1 Tax=Anastrepha obliqua TaxID=95512 RepID=UPI002409DFC1|nr:zinc finger protein 432 isoform X2 [Anastrepha obliqua]
MMQSAESAIPLSDNPTEYIDLSDYCRLCLQVPDESQLLDLQLIYDEEEQLSYYDCFTVCTQIDLRAGGTNAPHQLCKSCGLELQVAYDFHKKVEESKIFLEQLDQSQQLGDEVSPLTTTMKIERHGEPEDVGEVEVKTNEPQLVESLPAESEPIENDIVAGQDDTVGHFETSMEYEELEDQIDMDEYQSVDELVDEDAETVQIKIDNEEYLIRKINLSEKCKTDVLVDPVHKNHRASRTKLSECRNKTKPSSEASNLDVENDNHVIFKNASTESESELTNNKQNVAKIAEVDAEAHAEIDVKSVVISKKGDVKPRRRYSGKFTCDYCQKVFKNRSRMLTHRRSHEPNRPKFECEECGRLYATKQAKDVHIRTFHNRSGLKCPICGKVYVISKLLEVHMRYHTGDFPYVCDLCGQKFAQMCHLNTHKNVKHNSVRYSCEHPGCGKFFTSSASLRNHEFSHSAMPFECAYCKRGYPAKAKLKVHIRQKHGIEASLEQMEDMRKFHVMRSKLNLVKISEQ